MKTRLLVPAALLVIAVALQASSKATPRSSIDLSRDVVVENDRIVLRLDSHLLTKLEIGSIKSIGDEEKYYKAIGQIIVLANPSTVPDNRQIAWVELDPALTTQVGLDLHGMPNAQVGNAFGFVQVQASYGLSMDKGDKILVRRYGLMDSVPFAREGRIVNAASEPDVTQVTFQIEQGQNWLPGTTCEVAFPLLLNQGVRIPTTALLHEGTHEYVLQEVTAGQFVPQRVTIGEGTADEVDIVGGLKPGDRIVVRGAILLKPVLHELLEKHGSAR